MRIQLEFMKKRANRYAQEIRDNAERHEQELAQEKALTASKEKDLASKRLNIKELQAEIREFEITSSLAGVRGEPLSEISPSSILSRASPNSPSPTSSKSLLLGAAGWPLTFWPNRSPTIFRFSTTRARPNLFLLPLVRETRCLGTPACHIVAFTFRRCLVCALRGLHLCGWCSYL